MVHPESDTHNPMTSRKHAALKALPALVRRLDTRIAMPPPKTADDFYATPAWRKLRNEIVAERGYRCEDPHCDGPPYAMLYGDHVVELKDGGAPLDKANILLRCPPCHARKTARARADRMR